MPRKPRINTAESRTAKEDRALNALLSQDTQAAARAAEIRQEQEKSEARKRVSVPTISILKESAYDKLEREKKG